VELVKSYVEAFGRRYRGKGIVNILDLFDETGNATGTKVNIQIPLVLTKE